MQIKVASPEESGCIVARKNVHFSDGDYERRSSKLARMKMRNAELYLKAATVVYDFHPLWARWPELVSKLERLD